MLQACNIIDVTTIHQILVDVTPSTREKRLLVTSLMLLSIKNYFRGNQGYIGGKNTQKVYAALCY